MSLASSNLSDLAPADHFGLVDRYLPDPYRRALSAHHDPMATLTRSVRTTLQRALSELDAVQRSRALIFFNDLSDGALLGALHDQSPWPEEQTEEFRARLGQVAQLAMQGAATAKRLLYLAALACSAQPLPKGPGAQAIPPQQAYDFSVVRQGVDGTSTTRHVSGQTGPNQTRQFFEKPKTGVLVPIDVIDAPLRRFATQITPQPTPDYQFVLENPASETLAGFDGSTPLIWPDPTFRITTGATSLGPLALVCSEHALVLLVNRRLPPNSWLEVRVRDMAWTHEPGTSQMGPLTCLGSKQALYAGHALSADDHRVTANTGSTGPLLSLREKDALNFTGVLPAHPATLPALTAPGLLTLPSFLGRGLTRWRLLHALPGSDGDVHTAQFVPVAHDADLTLSARWNGRLPGEFALRLPMSALAQDMTGPLTHRQSWLDTMVQRFKLAGTVRLDEDMLHDPQDDFIGLTELSMKSRITPSDALRVTNIMTFAETTQTKDTIILRPSPNLTLTSRALPSDEITLKARVLLAITDSATPSDTIHIVPELVLDLQDSAHPNASVTLTLTGAQFHPPPEVITPSDTITLTPGARPTPPLISITFTSQAILSDHIVLSALPPLDDPPSDTLHLHSEAQLSDRIILNRG